MKKLLFLAGIIAFAPALVWADCYASWHCSSAQCASVMGGYSGRNGPYSSAAECQSKFGQMMTASNFSCSCSGNSTSGGSSRAPGNWSPGSTESPMSSENYRPDFKSDIGSENMSSETSPALVDAQKIELPYPWEPPPTCVARFPKMSDRYDQLLTRRKKDQHKLDVDVAACSGVEAGSIVEAECNKRREAIANSYRVAIQVQNETDGVNCGKYIAQNGGNRNAEQRLHSGLACAVTDIYTRFRSLGKMGEQFANQLHQDVEDAQFTSSLTPQDPKAVAITSLGESGMFSWHKNTPVTSRGLSQQMTVDVLVSHHGDDGSVVIQAISASLDESNQRSNEQNTLLVYDKAGDLIGGDYSPSVRQCLAKVVRTTRN